MHCPMHPTCFSRFPNFPRNSVETAILSPTPLLEIYGIPANVYCLLNEIIIPLLQAFLAALPRFFSPHLLEFCQTPPAAKIRSVFPNRRTFCTPPPGCVAIHLSLSFFFFPSGLPFHNHPLFKYPSFPRFSSTPIPRLFPWEFRRSGVFHFLPPPNRTHPTPFHLRAITGNHQTVPHLPGASSFSNRTG